MLVVDDISKWYGTTQVLKNLSLTVRQNETVTVGCNHIRSAGYEGIVSPSDILGCLDECQRGPLGQPEWSAHA